MECFVRRGGSGRGDRDGAVNALLGEVSALLCDAHGRAPLQVGPFLSQSLEGLGVAPALASQLVTHLTRPDLKLVKSVLREMLQASLPSLPTPPRIAFSNCLLLSIFLGGISQRRYVRNARGESSSGQPPEGMRTKLALHRKTRTILSQSVMKLKS